MAEGRGTLCGRRVDALPLDSSVERATRSAWAMTRTRLRKLGQVRKRRATKKMLLDIASLFLNHDQSTHWLHDVLAARSPPM